MSASTLISRAITRIIIVRYTGVSYFGGFYNSGNRLQIALDVLLRSPQKNYHIVHMLRCEIRTEAYVQMSRSSNDYCFTQSRIRSNIPRSFVISLLYI